MPFPPKPPTDDMPEAGPPKGPPMAKGPPKPPAEAKPPGGGHTPESVAAEVEAQIPDPTQGGYSYKLVCQLADETGDALKTLTAGHKGPDGKPITVPEIAHPPKPTDGDMLQGKLPVQVLLPAVMASDLAVSMGGPAGARYKVDITKLVDDDALEMFVAQMKTLAGDKKLAKAIMKGTEEPDADEAGGPSDADADNAPVEKGAGAQDYR